MTLRSLIALLALTGAACSPGTRADSPPASVAPAPSAPGADAGPAAGTVPERRPRIVFLGDSLTAGLGLRADESVPALIQAHLDAGGYQYAVVNAGVSGDTSAGGLRRLDWSLEGDVRLLVVELGANDGLRGLPVAAMRRNLAEIIAAARRRQIRVLLAGMEAPPNYGAAYTTEFRQAFRDLATQPGVSFVPFFLEGVAGNAALNQADGIHPNPEGAGLVARTLWRAIEPLLEARDR